MLKLKKGRTQIQVETMGARLVWDRACGGQLCELTVKDELFAHPLLPAGQVAPDLQVVVDGQRVRLAESTASDLSVTRQEPDYVVINTRTPILNGRMVVTQEYEIHEEGVMFCNLALETPAGKSLDLQECSLNFGIDVASARLGRWGYFTREATYKKDYSTVHAFVGFGLHRELNNALEVRDLLPFVSLDLGWEATRYYSNKMEFFIEDRTNYVDGPFTQTCTRVGAEGGRWFARWFMHEGSTVKITGPHRYRNRWGIAIGRARTQRGADADPAVRNNALGARVCHAMYPYARSGAYWPWASMPIKQIPEQPPQLFQGNPELPRVDEVAELGATLMVIHQFWMSNPGSNNEPCADYHVNDPKWFRAYIKRCHEHRMPVLAYVRGTEQWQHYSPFFEEYLKKNFDGFYADWNTAFTMGWSKCSPLHLSLHNFFHFTKAQRRRVGPNGVLIGHTSITTALCGACFDVAFCGEVSVRHDELLTDPESTSYFAALNTIGGHLMSGYLPDRASFSSPMAMALLAAMGMTSHPFMEPGKPFAKPIGFIKPLWDAMGTLPGKIVRLHNPAYAPTRAVATGSEHLYPSLWLSDKNEALLLVTNLGQSPESGAVELNLKELGLPKTSAIQTANVPGMFNAGRVDGQTVRLDKIPSLQFAAFRIGKAK